MPLLDGLNPSQRQAVQAIDGPVLVLAGPGSGKTRVLTHRIAYLINEVGVDPYSILAVTFTNKAAREMRERLDALIGGSAAQALTVGTFHSICTRFLRRDIIHLGRERDFAIYDSDDQDRLMRRVLRDLNLDEKKNPPRAIHAKISSAKNELVGPAEYARLNRSFFDEIVVRCYERYQALLRESNALDFDDILVETVRLFEQHPAVLERYQNRYIYLLVDEYQDTNRAQYVLVKQLAGKHKNLFVVGDEDQCLPAGTLVRTPNGEKPIETIAVGDLVIAGAGRGTVTTARVTKTRSRPYSGKLIRSTLANGSSFAATPNHMCFARLGLREDMHYVYLIYRADRGYRLGVAKGARSDGIRPTMQPGLQMRVKQEHADKAWILKVCSTRGEAQIYEQYFSVTYGLPTTIFFNEGRGNPQITAAQIEWLYAQVPTPENALRLMRDLCLSAVHPHYRPGTIYGYEKPHRLTVHLIAFGGNAPTLAAPWYRHRVWLNTSDRMLKQQVLHNGLMTRPGKRQTWRIERSYKEFGRTLQWAQEIADAVGGCDITHWAALTSGDKFAFQPAAHLRPTMLVPVWQDEQLVDSEIVTVEEVDYEGVIYDLDIEHLHNYIANGVAVHNSVYGWRGADIRNILQFEQDYPTAQVILLEQNYRSTQSILDVAQAVIHGGAKRKHIKKLWTENGQGLDVSLHEGYDQTEEAQFVAEEIGRLIASGEYKLGDCAVMYRTNAQSRSLEEALIARGLRYQIVGGTRFYERKEIKDVLAYLRLAHNPYDSVSLLRVVNIPARGIGDRSEAELTRWATELGVPLYQALQEIGDGSSKNSPFNTRTANALIAFREIIAALIAERAHIGLVELIDLALDKLAFREHLQREYSGDEVDDRWNNVQELRTVALDYANLPIEAQLPTFLEEVALVADTDSMEGDRDVITCITLHQAKGLEYPIVFLIGLEEGLLPHSRSLDDKDAVEEERRLLYVGATRAKHRLYLLYAFRRTSYGRTNVSAPSRFLADIPRELLKQPRKRGTTVVSPQTAMFTNRSFSSQRHQERGNPQSSMQRRNAPTGPSTVSFSPGQHVRHTSFGEGIVISSRLVDGDEEVTVRFNDKERRLLASFARLERVEP
jgi:DNA helicase-2/ATP-dependent DNA helicase PcrA